jgi:hypothetical protein
MTSLKILSPDISSGPPETISLRFVHPAQTSSSMEEMKKYRCVQAIASMMAPLLKKQSQRSRVTTLLVTMKDAHQSCEHKTRKTRCKICGGGSVCSHGKRRDRCRICLLPSFCSFTKRWGCLCSQCNAGAELANDGESETDIK